MPHDRTTHLVAPVAGDGNRRRSFYRSFIQFLFSNLGLILIVVGYSVGGAFLFQLLEQYIELQNCQQGSIRENLTIIELAGQTYAEVIKHIDQINLTYQTIESSLFNFTNGIYQRRSQYRYKGQNCTESSDWSILSSLLFTVTVITSIGYGHVTPTSWEGQITCICYALIGIPIFLLCLANISSVLGDIFRFTYSGLLHCFCCACRTYTRNRRRENLRVYAGKPKKRRGIDYTGTTSADPSWPETYNPTDNKRNDNEYGYEYDDDNDNREDDEQDDIWNRMESRVPFGVVIVIIIGYIFLGALIFTRFENWTMTESVYFCYITLATIGFGDFVPGITSGSASGFRFLLASIYILFGLAILAMCFDLIKEGIVDKVRWFADRLGILANDDDQIDEDHPYYADFQYVMPNHNKENRVTPIEKAEKIGISEVKWKSTSSEPSINDTGSTESKEIKTVPKRFGSATGVNTKKPMKTPDDKL